MKQFKSNEFDDIILFGYAVLKSEDINGFKIKIVEGNEGFCHKDKQVIHIGKGAVENKYFDLMLHEITHILTDAYHYSKEFVRIEKRLIDKYL